MLQNAKNKVELVDIEAAIVSKTFTRMPSGRTLVCEITLKNGFTVRGESSVVDPANYKQEVGEEYALADAIDNCWPLFGFLLAEARSQNAGNAPVLDGIFAHQAEPTREPQPLTPKQLNGLGDGAGPGALSACCEGLSLDLTAREVPVFLRKQAE
jgi:hypothetical protein